MTDSSTQVVTSRKLAVINSLSGIVTHILSVIVLVWLQKYLLDRVSNAEYSLFPIVQAPMLFLPLLTAALTGGLARFSMAAYARGDERGVTEIVSTMTPLLMGGALVVMLFGGLLAFFIDDVLNIEAEFVDDAQWMVLILSAGAASRVAFSAFGIGIFIKQKFVIGNIIDVTGQLVRIVLLWILLVGIDVRVVWVVLATTISNTVAYFARLIFSRRLMPGIRLNLSAIRWSIAPEIISFGSWQVLQRLVGSSRMFVTIYFLNHWGSPIHLTAFHLGRMVMVQMQKFTQAALRPLAPPLVAMWANGQTDRLSAAYLNGGRYALWLASFVSVPALIFGPPALELYLAKSKVDIALTTQVLMIVTAVPLIRFGNIMMGRISNAAGLAKKTCWIMIINHAVIVIAIGIAVVAYDLGALGAALGMIIGNIITVPLISIPFALKLTNASFSRWLKATLVPGLLPGAVGAAVWTPLVWYIQPTSWLGLILCGAAGTPAFVLGVWFLAMKPRERQDLLTIVNKARLRFLG